MSSNQNTIINHTNSKSISRGFYYYLSLFLAVGCIIFELWYFSIFKSIKKASIFIKNYKEKNEQHFQILKVLFLCGIWGGLYFDTRLNWKRAFRSKTAYRGFKSFCPCQRIEPFFKKSALLFFALSNTFCFIALFILCVNSYMPI